MRANMFFFELFRFTDKCSNTFGRTNSDKFVRQNVHTGVQIQAAHEQTQTNSAVCTGFPLDELFASTVISNKRVTQNSKTKINTSTEMDELENEFFHEDKDDIFDAAFSGECGSLSLSCSLLETSQSICSDKFNNNLNSSSKFSEVKTDIVEVMQDKSLHDHRFSGRFRPKVVKRKFAGPAGLILDEVSEDRLSCHATSVSKKMLAEETVYLNISSSQSSTEELFQSSSWKKLQDEVSSNSSFLSIVNNFSIHRVLSDTSKQKLPKHIIVPALCVYIKEFNDPVCVFMDDTGEIDGKIDKEVLLLYGDFIKGGTSLVLKQVTFLCNVLLLRKANVLTFYLDNGSAQHLQDWNAFIEKESPEYLNCTHPMTVKKLTEKYCNETVKKTVAKPRLDMNNKLLSSENDHSGSSSVSRNFHKNKMQNLVSNSTTSQFNQDFETDIDEFDELLGSLDEKSLFKEV